MRMRVWLGCCGEGWVGRRGFWGTGARLSCRHASPAGYPAGTAKWLALLLSPPRLSTSLRKLVDDRGAPSVWQKTQRQSLAAAWI